MVDEVAPPPESRDESLARALAVEPLDELTRRRLVHDALAATDLEPGREAPAPVGVRRSRILGAAAASVAFVVLGVAALTLPHSDTTDVAGRAPRSIDVGTPAAPEAASTPSVSDRSATPAAADAAGSSEKTTTSLPDLGGLGDVGTTGSRERVLAAAAPVVDGVAPQRWSYLFQSCPPHTLTAVATGRAAIDGEPVFVVVSRRDDGSLRVRAIDGTTCTLRSLP